MDQPFYAFSNIASITINSRALNGNLKLIDSKKKIILDSVAIPIRDQKEIAAFVNKKLH